MSWPRGTCARIYTRTPPCPPTRDSGPRSRTRAAGRGAAASMTSNESSASSKRACARWRAEGARPPDIYPERFNFEDAAVKIYRVKEGAIIQDESGAYLYETDWDELINRDDLAWHLSNLLDASALRLLGEDFAEEVLAPLVSQEV